MAQRYESDRTWKEKIALEKQKLSNMTFREKLTYFWDYYKPVLVGFFILLLVIQTGIEIYHNSRIVNLLQIGAINSFVEDGAVGMEQQLLELLGTGDPYEEVTVDSTYGFGNSMEEADYNMVTKFTTIIMSNDMDILICPEFVYEYYQQDTFMTDLSTLFTKEECEKYGIQPGDLGLNISGLPYYDQFELTQYEPVYLVVIEGGKHPENAVKFIKYIEEGTIDG